MNVSEISELSNQPASNPDKLHYSYYYLRFHESSILTCCSSVVGDSTREARSAALFVMM